MVAAIAGLAALAVVLVQNVVDQTAEQIESSDARQTAASLATTELEQRWKNELPTTQGEANEINRKYRTRCRHYATIYADISLTIVSKDGIFDQVNNTGWTTGPGQPPTCTTA